MKPKTNFFKLLLFSLLISCGHSQHSLPILGNRELKTDTIDGKIIQDTVYQTIPAFSFLNQDGEVVNSATVKDKIVVADFFFATCPTICPVMKKQLIRVFDAFRGDSNILILSHTIDPEHDTIALLKDYCTRLGSNGRQWMFLWGNRDSIYEIAEKGYYATAQADSTAPGGYIHSGGFILVDRKGRVRGIYNGTEETEVNHLIKDIDLLKKEK